MGEKVRVDTSEAKAVRLQEDHGGWNNDMKKVCTQLRATLLKIRLVVGRIHVCAYVIKEKGIHKYSHVNIASLMKNST